MTLKRLRCRAGGRHEISLVLGDAQGRRLACGTPEALRTSRQTRTGMCWACTLPGVRADEARADGAGRSAADARRRGLRAERGRTWPPARDCESGVPIVHPAIFSHLRPRLPIFAMRRILLCALHAAPREENEDNVVVPYYDAFAGLLVPERDLKCGQPVWGRDRKESGAGTRVAVNRLCVEEMRIRTALPWFEMNTTNACHGQSASASACLAKDCARR